MPRYENGSCQGTLAKALCSRYCGDRLTLVVRAGTGDAVSEGTLTAACGPVAPSEGRVRCGGNALECLTRVVAKEDMEGWLGTRRAPGCSETDGPRLGERLVEGELDDCQVILSSMIGPGDSGKVPR